MSKRSGRQYASDSQYSTNSFISSSGGNVAPSFAPKSTGTHSVLPKWRIEKAFSSVFSAFCGATHRCIFSTSLAVQLCCFLSTSSGKGSLCFVCSCMRLWDSFMPASTFPCCDSGIQVLFCGHFSLERKLLPRFSHLCSPFGGRVLLAFVRGLFALLDALVIGVFWPDNPTLSAFLPMLVIWVRYLFSTLSALAFCSSSWLIWVAAAMPVTEHGSLDVCDQSVGGLSVTCVVHDCGGVLSVECCSIIFHR